MLEAISELIEYHNNSPASLHHLDENGIDLLPKPDPVGDYEYRGTERIKLSLDLLGRGHTYRSLYTGAWRSASIDLTNLSQFLRHGIGLANWKLNSFGEQLTRTYHSIDKVYPIEVYVINYGAVEGLPTGLFHFFAKNHELCLRAKFNKKVCDNLKSRFGEDAFLVAFSQLPWKHTIKSNERGWRNTQLDQGHAIANMQMSAATHGWDMFWLKSINQDELDLLLGLLPESEELRSEFSSSLWRLRTKEKLSSQESSCDNWQDDFENLHFEGDAPLVNDQQSSASMVKNLQNWCRMENDFYPDYSAPLRGEDERWLHPNLRSEKILRSYQVAEEFDSKSYLNREDFLAILDKTLQRSDRYPFDGLSISPKVHLLFFVHRVLGLESGLYCLSRDFNSNSSLKKQMASEFEWLPEGGPANFYRLQSGDFSHVTSTLWNQSHLSKNAIFHTMMLADFDKSVRLNLPAYPHLFWESGMIAQVLSTEATALNHGTHHLAHFIDEQCHLFLGLKSDQFRCIYLSCYGQSMKTETVYKPAYFHLT